MKQTIRGACIIVDIDIDGMEQEDVERRLEMIGEAIRCIDYVSGTYNDYDIKIEDDDE